MAFWTPAPTVIAGPCVLEEDSTNLLIAERLLEIGQKESVRVIFKASFDKANRSGADAPRGPGIERGLEQIDLVRRELDIALLTDVHEPWQAKKAAAVVDALQVPAFLCRQTDLLTAVGKSGLPVNLKKGQWAAAEAMRGAANKVRKAGTADIAVTERGSFFGYGDLVVDMRNFRRMREAAEAVVLYDATHSLQRPGLGTEGSSGGNRQFCADLAMAAAAAGAEGFYLETHPSPDSALCDSATMVPIDELSDLIRRMLDVWRVAQAEVE